MVTACILGVTTAFVSDQNVWAWGDSQRHFTDGNITSIAGSEHYSVAIMDNGKVIAWGDNPPDLSILTNISAISAFVALHFDGTLFSWAVPHPSGLTNVFTLAIGASSGPSRKHNLAVLADGTVVAWGQNEFGQCNVPAELYSVIAVTAGGDFSVALKSDGTVVAWGDNSVGQLNVPAGLDSVASIGAGRYHTLALRKDGTVIAWGLNSAGQVNVPIEATNVAAIAVGVGHNLILRSNGTLFAWGLNSQGQCDIPSNLPLINVISAGSFHSLAAVNTYIPRITRQPASRTALVGSTVRFSVVASGSGNLSYQWYFGNDGVYGTTNSTLLLTNVQPEQSGVYTVRVTGRDGLIISDPASLSVIKGLGITCIPGIVLEGDIGSLYRVEYINVIGPTDAWQILAEITLTNSPQYYPDFSAIGRPARFYRLVLPP